MSILTLGSKKKEKKENFQSKKEKKKRKGNFQSKRKKRRGKEIPNQRVGERKKKERKFPTKEWEKVKKKERKFLIEEARRNMQRGLWTGQYLNNTELSPNEQKEGKESTT